MLWHTLDPKRGKETYTTFTMLFDDMQENLSTTLMIPPEVVRENQGITDFKASRHNMLIQAIRDPKKEWLQLRYCVT
jgi:hypothetical protein